MSAKIFYQKDADPELIKGKQICVLGYGSQGRAHARNLHESGMNVVVGLREGSKSFETAKSDGVAAKPMADAIEGADLVAFLLPDQYQAQTYQEFVAPKVKAGMTLLFAHGFSVHYGQITPPADVDVIMVAPKGPGATVREQYEQGAGVPCLLAVHQDSSGQAHAMGLSYASGIGGARAGVLETSFQEEAESDLFGEQAVLCGGLSALMQAGFDTLVEAGYAPEMAYFECIHEMKLIVDLVYRGGLEEMRRYISDTAKYGDFTRGPRIVTKETKETMKEILAEIQDGRFAREWVLENQAKLPVFNARYNQERAHLSSKVGAELRSKMSFLGVK